MALSGCRRPRRPRDDDRARELGTGRELAGEHVGHAPRRRLDLLPRLLADLAGERDAPVAAVLGRELAARELPRATGLSGADERDPVAVEHEARHAEDGSRRRGLLLAEGQEERADRAPLLIAVRACGVGPKLAAVVVAVASDVVQTALLGEARRDEVPLVLVSRAGPVVRLLAGLLVLCLKPRMLLRVGLVTLRVDPDDLVLVRVRRIEAVHATLLLDEEDRRVGRAVVLRPEEATDLGDRLSVSLFGRAHLELPG